MRSHSRWRSRARADSLTVARIGFVVVGLPLQLIEFVAPSTGDGVFFRRPVAEVQQAAAITTKGHVRMVKRNRPVADGTAHSARHASIIGLRAWRATVKKNR